MKLLLFFFLLSLTLTAQTLTRIFDSPLFFKNSTPLNNVFSGGHNNPEFQFIDVTGDGKKELFLLDSDGSVSYYVNEGTVSSPDYHLYAIPFQGIEFKDWFFFTDIDNDGDKDYFTGRGDNYIRFYRNNGSAEAPFFTKEIDTLRDVNGEPVFSESACNPVFTDVDADGDYDLISGNSSGSLSFIENTGSALNFRFTFRTTQWLNIIIIGGGSPAGFHDNRHGASSIDFADIDNDGDNDMIWGDFFSTSLYYLENNGTAASPSYFVKHSFYPSNSDSLITSGFNMPRFTDFDGDGDFDLIVSVLYDPSVPQSLIYYRNAGTPAVPDFRKVTEDYFSTVDFGIQSAPVFCDIDGDGDFDLFTGSANNPNGSIHYFENTGSRFSPLFQYRTDTFAGITGELTIVPSFADVDSDGDYDLVTGRFDGKLMFYRNTGTAQNPSFTAGQFLTENGNTDIDAGLYSRPFLFDYDSDGDIDIICGAFNGRFTLYRNDAGNFTSPFTKDITYFQNLDVGDNSSPFMFNLTGDEKPELITGNRAGSVLVLSNTGTVINPVWNPQQFNLPGGFAGSELSPWISDFDGDSDPDFIFGNYRGGLIFFRNDEILSAAENFTVPEKFSVSAYPNPFNSGTKISFSLRKSAGVRYFITNINGERIFQSDYMFMSDGTHTLPVDFAKLSAPSGIYIFTLTTGKATAQSKLVYIK